MFVKFCGLTRECDVEAAIECGADALGFVFYEKSPRYISAETARKLLLCVKGTHAKAVGVFVDMDADGVMAIARDVGLDYVQVYSWEVVQKISVQRAAIMAYRLRSDEDLARVMVPPGGLILLDSFSPTAFGGIGSAFEWNLLLNFPLRHRAIIAGGLDAHNVAELIFRIRPFGVDVSSGIEERPGMKSVEKMRAFMKQVKEAIARETIA